MADRVVENESAEVPEIPEALEKVMLFALDEGKAKMSHVDDMLVPFTCLVIKENMFIESHPGDSAEECFNYAKHTVQGARGAEAYAFCYDGYVETDDGMMDALIAEGGVPGDEDGFAVCYLYEVDAEGKVSYEEEPAYVGQAPNFMSALKDADEYSDEEIDGRYLEEDESEL